MKKTIIGAMLLASLAAPAWAKNFAFPEKNPIATITIPDKWKTDEIEYGYSAKSPDGDVFFSVESTSAKGLDKMMATNTQWMKDNKIRATAASTTKDFKLGGLDASLVSFPAKDENGATVIDFVFIQAGKDRVVMLTLWASDEERQANGDDIMSIQRSIKAIN